MATLFRVGISVQAMACYLATYAPTATYLQHIRHNWLNIDLLVRQLQLGQRL